MDNLDEDTNAVIISMVGSLRTIGHSALFDRWREMVLILAMLNETDLEALGLTESDLHLLRSAPEFRELAAELLDKLATTDESPLGTVTRLRNLLVQKLLRLSDYNLTQEAYDELVDAAWQRSIPTLLAKLRRDGHESAKITAENLQSIFTALQHIQKSPSDLSTEDYQLYQRACEAVGYYPVVMHRL